MAQLLQAPYSQFFDANGVPLAGGKVYTYAAGTGYVTPQASYTDSTGGTPAANPVVLDSAGRAAIWLSGSYGIVVKDSIGNTIMSTDGITTSGSAASSTFLDGSFLIENTSDATKKAAFDASGITTGTQRKIAIPDKNGTLAMTSDISGKVTCYQVTDATDISLSAVPTQANVGSTKSIVIPTKGVITWAVNFESISTTSGAGVIFGLRIGSTNYWPTGLNGATTEYSPTSNYNSSAVTSVAGAIGAYGVSAGGTSISSVWGATSNIVGIFIETSGIPTGTQTVQLIAGMATNGGTSVLKGTVVTTRAYITVCDHT